MRDTIHGLKEFKAACPGSVGELELGVRRWYVSIEVQFSQDDLEGYGVAL
jgi:hypothetical protein